MKETNKANLFIGRHISKKFGKINNNLFVIFLLFFNSCINENTINIIKYDYAWFGFNEREAGAISILQYRVGDTIHRRIYDSIYSMKDILQQEFYSDYIFVSEDSLSLDSSKMIIKMKDTTCWVGDIRDTYLETKICFKGYDYYKNILCKIYYVDYGSTVAIDQYNQIIYLDTTNIIIMQILEDRVGSQTDMTSNSQIINITPNDRINTMTKVKKVEQIEVSKKSIFSILR